MSEMVSWRDRVTDEPVDAGWVRWWRRSWRMTPLEMAAKATVTRMTIHRWERGVTPVPSHIAAWMRDVLPPEPALPYPGMPAVVLEPATEDERREFAEMDLIQWPTRRRGRRHDGGHDGTVFNMFRHRDGKRLARNAVGAMPGVCGRSHDGGRDDDDQGENNDRSTGDCQARAGG